jgi:predicted outer membrane repeat protein
MKKIFTISLLMLLAFVNATIINVPADQPTIQEGINFAVDGDTILVHPRTYYENINFNGKNITVASLFFTTQDTSYISQTIIDGNQNGSVVIFENEEHLTTVLIGFTITNGNAYYGGGIKCRDYSSPSLKNLIILNNYSVYSGGGLYCKNNSNPELEDIIIKNNSSSFGGGIYCDNDSNLYIENVEIVNNSSNYGSGIYCGDSNPILKNLIITGNTGSQGGGIYFSHSLPSLDNTIIANNTSNYGGGIYSYYSNISLVNVTITENIAFAGGGVRGSGDSHPHFVNCILWNNSPEEISFNELGEPSSTFIEYSDIEGGENGIVTNNNVIVHWLEGNIDNNPLFIDSGNGDYHLSEMSPCIDAGYPTYPFDPDGTIADMGAYYYHQANEVENNEIDIKKSYLSNYPNPFNPSTTISFSVPQASSLVNLEIYNTKGQKVKTFSNLQITQSSNHQIIWNGTDQNDQPVSSGIYLYKLNVDGKTEAVKKCLLLK